MSVLSRKRLWLTLLHSELIIERSKHGFNVPAGLVRGEQFLFGGSEIIGGEILLAVSDNQYLEITVNRSRFHPVGIFVSSLHLCSIEFTILFDLRVKYPTVFL